MDEIITSTVAGVIVTLVGTVCGFLASQLKQARKSRDEREQHEAIVNEALRALLFDKIARLHAETVEQGKPAGVEVKRRADVAWKAYRALDPQDTLDDGTTAHLHAEIVAAHASEEQP